MICPNCGFDDGYEDQMAILPALPETVPMQTVAEQEPLQTNRLPHTTQVWMRIYFATAVALYVLSALHEDLILPAFAIAALAILHGLSVTVAMAHRRHMGEPKKVHHRRHAKAKP